MPTYEYHCDSCGETYDLHQGFSAATEHACEECGKGIAKRVLHAPRVVFKGSGWYVTDSRNSSVASTDSAPRSNGASESAASESGASESAGSDSGKASEAKPASKSEKASTSSGDSKVESSAAG